MKYQFVPRDLAARKKFDADLSWWWCSTPLVYIHWSRGKVLSRWYNLANEKRVLLFTINLMEVLARAKEILGDGTFKITPLLWGQLFVISAQVTPFVFVPVAAFLLPDKTSQHPEAFSLLREDWASPLSGSRSPASRLTTQGRRTLPSEVSAGLSVP